MVSISAISTSAGDYRPIEECIEGDSERMTIAALRADGFDTFLESDQKISELAKQTIEGTLNKIDFNPEEIDAVIFATESFWDFHTDRFKEFPWFLRVRNELLSVMSELGLVNAYPYGSWMSACANLAPSLLMGKSFIETGSHRNILLVSGERHCRSISRLMSNGAAVYSDIMASCLICENEQGYRVDHIVNVSDPAIPDMHASEDLPRMILNTRRALRKLDKKFSSLTNRTIRSYDNIIASHFHSDSIDIICSSLNLKGKLLSREGRRKIAHGHAVDNLVSLDVQRSTGKLGKGDEVLLLNTAIYMWSTIALTVTTL